MSTEIRQLIYEQITSDTQMAGMLAAYHGLPAFFYQKSPSDSRPGWGTPRYPRVDFNIDLRNDPERKTAGTLTVNIWCTTECPAVGDLDPDRAIERRLLELISGTFYTGADCATICADWERSDEFVFEGGSNARDNTAPEVYGLTMTFALMAFPEQISITPDPVQGLNAWAKQHFPQMNVIAFDELPPIWKPSDEAPALYWRFEGMSGNNQQSYAVAWFTGKFAAHVIADSVAERNKWTKSIIEFAQIEGEVVLSDGSPMFINRLEVRHSADPLREGQLGLTGQYGVLNQPQKELAQTKLLRPNLQHEKGAIGIMAEAAYKTAELAAKARQLFGTTPEVVTVALRGAGMESATVEEARQMVQDFLGREVQ